MALSLADANRIIGASIAEADRIGVKLSVAVVDGGGQMLAFQRMEGAIAVSATAAPGKAVGSVFFGRDSREINADSPVMQAIIGSQGGADHTGAGGDTDLPGRRAGGGDRRERGVGAGGRGLRAEGAGGAVGGWLIPYEPHRNERAPLDLVWRGVFVCPGQLRGEFWSQLVR